MIPDASLIPIRIGTLHAHVCKFGHQWKYGKFRNYAIMQSRKFTGFRRCQASPRPSTAQIRLKTGPRSTAIVILVICPPCPSKMGSMSTAALVVVVSKCPMYRPPNAPSLKSWIALSVKCTLVVPLRSGELRCVRLYIAEL